MCSVYASPTTMFIKSHDFIIFYLGWLSYPCLYSQWHLIDIILHDGAYICVRRGLWELLGCLCSEQPRLSSKQQLSMSTTHLRHKEEEKTHVCPAATRSHTAPRTCCTVELHCTFQTPAGKLWWGLIMEHRCHCFSHTRLTVFHIARHQLEEEKKNPCYKYNHILLTEGDWGSY